MQTSTAGGDAGRYGDVARLTPSTDGHADGRTPMLALNGRRDAGRYIGIA